MTCHHCNEKNEFSIKQAINVICNSQKIDKNISCEEHLEKFSYYCKDCNKNLCEKCVKSKEHKNHNIIDFNQCDYEVKIKNIKDNEIYKIFIKKINETEIMSKCENNSANDFLRDTMVLNKNFEVKNKYNIQNNKNNDLMSILSVIDKIDKEEEEEPNENYYYFCLFEIVFHDCETFPNYTHIENINNIANFFNYKFKKDKIEILLKYINNNKQTEIKLFGNKFIENNKELCYLIIDDKRNDLIEYLKLGHTKKKEELQIKLIIKDEKKFTNMSYIFHECTLLLSLEVISKMKLVNITDLSHAFHGCLSLNKIPDNIWDTSNVIDMSYLFYFCISLHEIPKNISEWDTSKVINMEKMFYGCGIDSYPKDICKNTNINTKDIFVENIKIRFSSMMLSINEEILVPRNTSIIEVLKILSNKSNQDNLENKKVQLLFGSQAIQAQNNLSKPIEDFNMSENGNILNIRVMIEK